MDKVQSFINAVDAALRSGTEQAAMRAQTGKLFVDFVTDLRPNWTSTGTQIARTTRGTFS